MRLSKKVDVRAHLRHVTVDRGGSALVEAGIVGDLLPLEVEVSLSASSGVKISEVVEAFFGHELPHRAVRSAMWAMRDGAKLEPLAVASTA